MAIRRCRQLFFKEKNLQNLSLHKYYSHLFGVDLTGRDVTRPDHLLPQDYKSILWTALDLKHSKDDLTSLLRGKHVFLGSEKSSARFQISFEQGAQKLGARTTHYFDAEWSLQPDIVDTGRLLSSMADVIVTSGVSQMNVDRLADGSSVPVINYKSDVFSIVKALSDFLTIFETIGPLRRKWLAWVGPPSALCNTYLCIAPMLKMNMKVFCTGPNPCGLMSAVNMEKGYQICQGRSELHESTSVNEAVYRCDIISTAMHEAPQHCITLKSLEEASLEWYLLHSLPRTKNEVSNDVYKHKNNLTWSSAENTTYIAMAILMRVLSKDLPTSMPPDFDGPE